MTALDEHSPHAVKSCCAAAYESRWAQLLLGDSLHPGGLDLTLHTGRLLGLQPGTRVLDVASGHGASAIALAREFGCVVVGVDLSEASVRSARPAAQNAGMEHLVSFEHGDAEQLPFEDKAFDAVICECAFCTFPDKTSAASEIARVLRPKGRVAIADITRNGELPSELETLLGWVACLADARAIDEYVHFLRHAGFATLHCESHDDALARLISNVRLKLLALEVAARLGKAPVPLDEVLRGKRIVKAAAASLREGVLGYGLVTAVRTQEASPCST